MRLITLFDSSRDLPYAKDHIKSILRKQFDRMRLPSAHEAHGRSDSENYMRSPTAQEAPGCRDPQAHRGLLKIWLELETDNADNTAVEEAVRTAFLSHSRPRRQAIATSEGQEENSMFIPRHDEFSIPVKTINIKEATFENALLTIFHKPAEEVLQVHVEEQHPGQGNGTLDIRTTRPYNLKHSTSKKRVALERTRDEDNHLLDIQLNSMREGETLIERLQVLPVTEYPHT